MCRVSGGSSAEEERRQVRSAGGLSNVQSVRISITEVVQPVLQHHTLCMDKKYLQTPYKQTDEWRLILRKQSRAIECTSKQLLVYRRNKVS